MKYKINQTVWHFDKNIWKPVKDKVYDYNEKTGFYDLENDRSPFEETELYSSSAKCLAAQQ